MRKTSAGKFYADWRDQHRVRHRQAFTTAKAAQAFQTKMQRKAAEKKAPRSAPSATSARRGRTAARRARPSQPQPGSSR